MINFQDEIGIIYEGWVCEMAYGRAADAIPIPSSEITNKVAEAEMQGVRPISVTTITQPNVNKSNRLYNELMPIYKVSRMIGKVGEEYETKRNNLLVRQGEEPTFKAQQGWGKHLSKSIIRGPKGDAIMIQGDTNSPVRSPASIYITGRGAFRVLTPEEKAECIKPVPAAPVVVRKPYVANIVGITIGGSEYTISDMTETQKEVLRVAGI